MTPTVSKARAPTHAMSTLPAFTSSSVPASYVGSPSRQFSLKAISRVPSESRLTSSANADIWSGTPLWTAIVSTWGSVLSAPPALSLSEPLHAAMEIVAVESTAASAHPMNRLVCIVPHLHLSVPSTLRPDCSVHIGALPRLVPPSMGTALVLRKGRHWGSRWALCDDAHMVLRRVLWPVGFALGAVSLALARDEPAFSFAGSSLGGAVALLGAGWALLSCGLVFWGRRSASTVGPLLVAAGCAWFLAEWDNPGVGAAAAFTIGLVLFAACPPFAAWAMLAYPGGRLGFWVERVAVAVALAGATLVLGLLPALFYDPATFGCIRCPDNLLLVSDDPGLVDDLNVLGVHLGLAWSLLLMAVAAWRVARSSRARRRVVAPVVLAGCAYLGLVAGSFATSLGRGFVGSGELERRLWLGEAAALAALAAAVAWGLLRTRRTRSSLARLVIELSDRARAGGLRDALARRARRPGARARLPGRRGPPRRRARAVGRPWLRSTAVR